MGTGEQVLGPGAPGAAVMTAEESFAHWEAELAAQGGAPRGAMEESDWQQRAEVDALLAAQGSARSAAEELADALESAEQGLDRAGELGPGELVSVFDPGVVDALETVGRLRSTLDGVGFSLAAEADLRGLHTAVGLSLVDWLRVRCPWMSSQEAHQMREVVRATQRHWGQELAGVMRAGAVPVHRASRVARTMIRLAPCLCPDDQIAFASIVTQAASNPEISDQQLEMVCKQLLIDLLDEKPHEDRERNAQELRCVSRRRLARGMTRFTIDAPEWDATLIDGVLAGPLTAPEPISHEDGAEVDVRSAGQRKFDALLMVINRGMSNPGAPPSSGRASVMITVKADPATGEPQGAAVSSTGQVFTARSAGRFACIGDLTPIALGEYGEPLNLGRTVRLATPGQFKALMIRDGHCTYPGCSVPGTWCDAHHLVWWCRGGNTDLVFLVLLCPRHHSLVHSKDLMATVAGSVVTWHV